MTSRVKRFKKGGIRSSAVKHPTRREPRKTKGVFKKGNPANKMEESIINLLGGIRIPT